MQQYWAEEKPWRFVPPAAMAEAFEAHALGHARAEALAVPPERTEKGAPALIVNLTRDISSVAPPGTQIGWSPPRTLGGPGA